MPKKPANNPAAIAWRIRRIPTERKWTAMT